MKAHLHILLTLVLFISCSGNLKETQEKFDKYYGPCDNPSRTMSKMEYNICKDKERAKNNDAAPIVLGGIFNRSGQSQVTYAGMPINQELWQASLKTLDPYSLKIVDSQGGYLETDWIFSNNATDERCAIKVNITSQELISTGVNAKIICQKKSEDNWINQPEDIEASKNLTLKILNNAQLNNQ